MFNGRPFSKGLSREVIRQGDNLVIFLPVTDERNCSIQFIDESLDCFFSKNNVGIHRIQVCGYCTRLFSCVVDQFMNGCEISCKEIIMESRYSETIKEKRSLKMGPLSDLIKEVLTRFTYICVCLYIPSCTFAWFFYFHKTNGDQGTVSCCSSKPVKSQPHVKIIFLKREAQWISFLCYISTDEKYK